MNQEQGRILVYYDGACPSCIRDRNLYEKLATKAGKAIYWVDITGKEQALREEGIDPDRALRELHVRDKNGKIVSELDAYILLFKQIPKLKFLAYLINLPLIRPLLTKFYHHQVNRRLHRTERI